MLDAKNKIEIFSHTDEMNPLNGALNLLSGAK